MRLAVLCLLASGLAFGQSMIRLNPTMSPSPRRSSALAVQPVAVGERLWTFGGFDGAARNDLYYYDTAANTWVSVPQTNTPTPRERHALGWSPKHQRLVMVGGMRFSGLNFTWFDEVQVYNPATGAWTSYALPSTRPAPRADAAMHWVPSLQKFVYFGGSATLSASPRYNDLWLLDLDVANTQAIWTELLPSGSAPSRRGAACTALDSDRGLLVVFGGETDSTVMVNDTFRYDFAQNRWSDDAPALPPSARAFCATDYDPLVKRVVLYGGQAGSNPVGGAFLYDPMARAWQTVGASPNPGPLSDAASAYSAVLGGMVLFGGRMGGTSYSNETWLMRNNLPPEVDAGPNQTVAEDVMVLLQGSAVDPEDAGVTYLWSQDGGVPVSLRGANSPTATFLSPRVTRVEVLTFVLECSDGITSGKAVTSVTVQDTINELPQVDAGMDQAVGAGEVVLLSGWASDPNGEPLSPRWTQLDGGRVALAADDAFTTAFVAPISPVDQALVFRLSVSDLRGGVGTDDVQVFVAASDAGPSDAGAADAGTNGTLFDGGDDAGPADAGEPRIVAPTALSSRCGEHLAAQIAVEEEGPWSFELVGTPPEGASIMPDRGELHWTPTSGQAGRHEIRVRVTGRGLVAERAIVLDVTCEPTRLNVRCGCGDLSGALALLASLCLGGMRRRRRLGG